MSFFDKIFIGIIVATISLSWGRSLWVLKSIDDKLWISAFWLFLFGVVISTEHLVDGTYLLGASTLLALAAYQHNKPH